MIKKIYITAILLFLGISSFSQKSVNDYKYLVIPNQYDFLKGKDKYRLNSLTRFLFKKKGYDVYFEDEELPNDLFNNRCLGMYLDVNKLKGFLSTKLQIQLKDCKGTLIITSQIGKTKEKDFAKAYNLALREAFETFDFIDYKYQPNDKVGEVTSISNNVESNNSKEKELEIERLKKEVEALKNEQNKEEKKTKVSDNETSSKLKESDAIEEKVEDNVGKTELLYAQPIEKGFQIINMKPEVVMVLLKTETKDIYKVEGKEAIVFKKGKEWIYAETKDSKTTERVINIRF